jgi:hypothetical protein
LPNFSIRKLRKVSSDFCNLEERMRVEMPSVPQSLIESPQNIDKKENESCRIEEEKPLEEAVSFFPSPLGSSGTYSVSSLKAAVEYHAKFLTVAENNLQAAQHPPQIPQLILDRLNGR